jgi:hypothetical protein
MLVASGAWNSFNQGGLSMTKNLKLPVYLACLVAPCLLASASVPSLADETYMLKNIISLPDAQTLRSFDISFVSPTNHRYALAVSATAPFPAEGTAANPRVVVVDTQSNVVIDEFNTTLPLAGSCQFSPNTTISPRNNYGGPNGSLIVEKGQNADIWVGDGPHFSTQCDPTTTVTEYSSAKVIDLHTGATRGVVSTGGIRRADELCYNPRSDVVLIANDDPLDNFITFIGEDSLKVIQKIKFDGSDPRGNNLVANGIEQCAYNPRDGKFYINLPLTATIANPSLKNPGVVLRISGEAPFHVEMAFTPSCGGAAGMAIGPDHQIGLACGTPAPNAEIIDDRNGAQIALLAGEGGADEMWYDPGSNHYFFGISTPGALGVVDAGPPPSPESPPTVPTAAGSHSVAANLLTNEVYVPIRSNSAASPPGNATICSSGKDVFGNPGNDNAGCIAVYTSTRDAADCVPEGVPVITVGTDGNPIYKKDRCHGH